jgi:hypothetical protein
MTEPDGLEFIRKYGIDDWMSLRKFTKEDGKMKKLLFILLILISAPSASASVYKWVDERGVLNFVDDYNRVPPAYRNHVEEISIPKMGPSTPSQTSPGNIRIGSQSGPQAPPIAQPLVREGDFAIKLVEGLKVGSREHVGFSRYRP